MDSCQQLPTVCQRGTQNEEMGDCPQMSFAGSVFSELIRAKIHVCMSESSVSPAFNPCVAAPAPPPRGQQNAVITPEYNYGFPPL